MFCHLPQIILVGGTPVTSLYNSSVSYLFYLPLFTAPCFEDAHAIGGRKADWLETNQWKPAEGIRLTIINEPKIKKSRQRSINKRHQCLLVMVNIIVNLHFEKSYLFFNMEKAKECKNLEEWSTNVWLNFNLLKVKGVGMVRGSLAPKGCAWGAKAKLFALIPKKSYWNTNCFMLQRVRAVLSA